MVTGDDLAVAILARCDATFQIAVPGKAWYLRADENAATPYSVFGIERAGEPEWQSDGSYLQEFAARMAAYSEQGAGVDPNVIQLAMAVAMNTAPTGWSALRAGRVLHCLPRGYDGRFAPQLRQSRDVFVSGAQWALLVEGTL